MKKQRKGLTPKPRILVVEDDTDDRDIFSYVFNYRTDCCELQFVEDGNAAITLLNSLPEKELPSLIVLDYNLPGFKGCDVIKQLSKSDKIKPIPKIIYSTDADEKIVGTCIKAGAKAYFRKSNTMGGVMHDIDKILQYIPGNLRA